MPMAFHAHSLSRFRKTFSSHFSAIGPSSRKAGFAELLFAALIMTPVPSFLIHLAGNLLSDATTKLGSEPRRKKLPD